MFESIGATAGGIIFSACIWNISFNTLKQQIKGGSGRPHSMTLFD